MADVVAARRFVDDLVRAKQLEVRRAGALATALVTFIDALGRPPTGAELEEFLEDHPQVEELYASRAVLEEVCDRYFRVAAVEVEPAASPELERQLHETEDPQAYLVYADWLQERGDPFGELIALGVAATAEGGEANKRFERFLEHNERTFLKGIHNALGSLVTLAWKNGVIDRVRDTDAMGLAKWKKLLDLRVASLIRSVHVRSHLDAELDELLADKLPALRALEVVGSKLPARLMRAPHLRELSIHMDALALHDVPPQIARLELQCRTLHVDPELRSIHARELVLAGAAWPVPNTPFVALAGIAFPALEVLELRGFDGPFDRLASLVLAQIAVPKLRRLAIASARMAFADLAALAALPFAAQLDELVLEGLALTDEALAGLAPLAAKATLRVLDVGNNELTPKGIALAKSMCAAATIGTQRAVGSMELDRIRAFAGGRFDAGEQLANDATKWTAARRTDDVRWSTYQGSDEYELYVTRDLQRYGCSCPSSYQPCKHVVGLAIVDVRAPLRTAPSAGIETRVGYLRFDVAD